MSVKEKVRTTFSVAFLLSLFMISGATSNAQEDLTKSSGAEEDSSNIKLQETEITRSLHDIVGSYKLQEMEIVGKAEDSQYNYILRWKNPAPFLDHDETLARNLIDPFYAPMDLEGYRLMIDITIKE